MPSRLRFPENKDLYIAVMADIDTITGFLLTGFGQNQKNGSNYFITDPKDEKLEEKMRAVLKTWLDAPDIGVVMIAQNHAETLTDMIELHRNREDKCHPVVLEIPSTEAPYDPTKDPVMKRIKIRLSSKQLENAEAKAGIKKDGK